MFTEVNDGGAMVQSGQRIPVSITVDAAASVNFAMHQNHIPLMRSMRVENISDRSLHDLLVRVTASRPIFALWERRLDTLSPGLAHRIEAVDLALDPGVLCNQVESEQLQLVVEVLAGGTPVGGATLPLRVLAFNEWHGAGGLADLIAAFVTPSHPSVDVLVAEAGDALKRMTRDPSFSGYQSRDSARVAAMVQATAAAFHARRVKYIEPPASFERTGQKIRSIDQILDGRLGTCLDLVIAFASVVEQIGLRPVVVLLKGHAMVGVWLREEQFPQTVVDDRAIVLKRVQLGELLLIETTALVEGVDAHFQRVQELALDQLSKADTFVCVVDVAACRRERILPLPSRMPSGTGFQVVTPAHEERSGPSVLERPVDGSPHGDRRRPAQRATSSRPDGLSDDASQRLDQWKRKLLDLTMRNRLLNYKETKRVVPLLVPDPALFEDLLAEGKRFEIRAKSDALRGVRDKSTQARHAGADVEKRVLLEMLNDGRLVTPLAPGELSRRLLQMYRDAKTSVEESGASTLYVAVGSLLWYESDSSSVSHIAPLVLVPAVLRRDAAGQVFALELADEEVRVNVTLLELLRTQFGIDGSGLTSLAQDDSGYDIRAAIRGFIELVKHRPRWEVREDAVLAHFSFAKFMMWADLEMRAKDIAANKVVRRLLDKLNPTPLEDVELIEQPDRPGPDGGPVPALDADSSQLAAVHAAVRGRTFVLQGPPGTGKSQTITNILASAIACGKRVLFVAEKMAALSVVKNRMERLGLGPYCLELHSAKSGKREVLQQIQEALNAAQVLEPARWTTHVRDVEAARAELNEYASSLHARRASGESVYTVIGRSARLTAAPKIGLTLPEPGKVTAQRLGLLRTRVATLMVAAKAAGDPATHPLRGLDARYWRPGLDDDLRDACELVQRRAADLGGATVELLSALGIGGGTSSVALSEAELSWLAKAGTKLLSGKAPNDSILVGADWPELKAAVVAEISLGNHLDELMGQLKRRYRDSLLAAELEVLDGMVKRATASAWPLRVLRKRAVVNALRAHALDPKATIIDPAGDIASAKKASAARKRLESIDSAGRRLMGANWGKEGRWDEAGPVLEWIESMREVLASRPVWRALDTRVVDVFVRLAASESERLAPGSATRRVIEAFCEKAQVWNEAFSALGRVATIRRSELVGENDEAFLDAIVKATKRWIDALDQLPDWCTWRDAEALDDAPELTPLARALSTGQLPAASASDAFERAFATAWLKDVLTMDPALARFSHARHLQAVERFRENDAAIVKLGGDVVKARRQRIAPVPVMNQVNTDSESGVLRHQLALQRRHMAVRRLIEKTPNVLPRLKPCWLMSPLSVAQYLNPKLPRFDLVVFDEASQIPAWDAVGALARGEEAVIVGDSKQLPPTSFFDTLDSGDVESEDDNDYNFVELESILDEAVASNLPTLDLRWHYRSRHESLIAFSNHHYYKDRLLTFPSPESATQGLGVSMVYLSHGRYDKAGSRTNRVEAEAVVAEVVRRLNSDQGQQESIGVVTFSMAQQRLVEDLLDAERRKNSELERFFGTGVEEPVFIKNLENVQGDERDVILFSICYGPYGDGQISMNFGPINRQGGERRLNVAITRARRQVVVFSSLKPEQIDLSRTRAVGAAHLRDFLDYATRGPRAILEATSPGNSTESHFEEAVREALVARGHLIDMQVGCSGYRIDLAVKDPKHPGRYILGIECDGAAYHSSKAARDRDRLREEVLRGLGWSIHRVWSTDWFQSRANAIARIEEAISRALEARAGGGPDRTGHAPLRAPSPAPLRSASFVPQRAPDDQSSAELRGSREYRSAILARVHRDAEMLRSGMGDAWLLEDVSQIVAQEGPVHIDRVVSVIKDAWGVGRMSARTKDVIDAVIARAERVGRLCRDGQFLLPRGGLPDLGSFRVTSPGSAWSRPVEQIHPAEIALAARAVLERDFSMPVSSLCAEVARAFGVQRRSVTAEAAVRLGIELLASSGRCRINGTEVSI